MGKKLKIFSLLVVFLALFLFPSPVKSECYLDAYGNCTGTCSCSTLPNFKCGTCECGYDENYFCMPWYTCHSCVTNTPAPQPTNTPKPTPGQASPTATPQPTTGGMQCSSSTQCYDAYCAPSLTPTPACSSVCINGHCYTTHPGINPTITDVACRSSNDYGPWSGCMSGQDACGGCASQGYTCQVRYCKDSSSNAYQISCGCSQPPGAVAAVAEATLPPLAFSFLTQILTSSPHLCASTARQHLPLPPTALPPQLQRSVAMVTLPLGQQTLSSPPAQLTLHPLMALNRLQATMPVFISIHPFAKSAATQPLVPLLPVNKMSPMPTSKESRPTRVGVFLTPITFLPSLASPPSKTKTSKKATTCPTAKTTINSKTATPGIRRFPQATAL